MCLLTFFTISRAHMRFGLESLRPAVLITLFAVAYAILQPRSLVIGGLLRDWPAKVLLAFGILVAVSIPFSMSPGGAAQFTINNFSKTITYAFLLLIAIRGAADLRLFVWTYVLSAGFLAYMAIFEFRLEEASVGSYAARLSHMDTYDANDTGLVLLVGLPLTLLTFQSSRWMGKLVSAIVLCAIGSAIARTGSRGAFVGLVIVGLLLLIGLRQVPFWRRLIAVGTVAIALAYAAPEGYWKQMETIIFPEDDYNLTSEQGRKQLALRGMGYMLSNPVLGVGINQFGRAEFEYSSRAYERGRMERPQWLAPHNSWVQVGSELGVTGLVLWSSLVLGGMVSMLRLRRRLPKHWLRGDGDERFLYGATVYLPIALAAFAVASSFLSFAYMDPIYVLAAFVAGVHQSVRLRLRKAVPMPARQVPRLVHRSV